MNGATARPVDSDSGQLLRIYAVRAYENIRGVADHVTLTGPEREAVDVLTRLCADVAAGGRG